MGKFRIVLLTFAVLLLGAGASALFYYHMLEQAGIEPRIKHEPPVVAEKQVAHLYFLAHNNEFLKAEDRVLNMPEGPGELGRLIVNELIKGPRSGLVRTLPEGVSLIALHVTGEGVAYVDISEEVTLNHPGGSQAEIFTIYSIVNSLVLNIPEVSSVKILIKGNEAATLAGHIDLRSPFNANMMLIR